MDDTRTTFIGLVAAALLAVIAGLLTQLFTDEQRVDQRTGEATYISVTQTIEAVTLTAEHIPDINPTETLTPTVVELSEHEFLYQVAREEWSLVAYEPFDDNQRGWAVGGDGDLSRGRREVRDGHYRWEVTALDDFTWITAPIEAPFENFYISAEMSKRGTTSGSHNLAFRYNDEDNSFDFGICEDGASYQAWRQVEDEWTQLIECVESEWIRPNETNILAVLAQTDQYHLYANGHYLTTIEDDTLTGGSVGVSIDLDSDQTNLFEFDNFELRVPLVRVGR